MDATSSSIGYICESTTECKIEKYAQKCEDGDTTEEEGQNDTEEGIQNASSGNSLNSAHPSRDRESATGQTCEKVGEDTKNGGGGEEFQEPDEGVR